MTKAGLVKALEKDADDVIVMVYSSKGIEQLEVCSVERGYVGPVDATGFICQGELKKAVFLNPAE